MAISYPQQVPSQSPATVTNRAIVTSSIQASRRQVPESALLADCGTSRYSSLVPMIPARDELFTMLACANFKRLSGGFDARP
jgi:hypothetical protein